MSTNHRSNLLTIGLGLLVPLMMAATYTAPASLQPASAEDVVERLRAFGTGRTLGPGLSVRDLIEEGRAG